MAWSAKKLFKEQEKRKEFRTQKGGKKKNRPEPGDAVVPMVYEPWESVEGLLNYARNDAVDAMTYAYWGIARSGDPGPREWVRQYQQNPREETDDELRTRVRDYYEARNKYRSQVYVDEIAWLYAEPTAAERGRDLLDTLLRQVICVWWESIGSTSQRYACLETNPVEPKCNCMYFPNNPTKPLVFLCVMHKDPPPTEMDLRVANLEL